MKNFLLFCLLGLGLQLTMAQDIDLSKAIFYFPFNGSVDNGITASNVVLVPDEGGRYSVGLTYQTGKFGNAGLFSSTSYLTQNLNFNTNQSFSIVAWVKLSTIDNLPQTFVHQETAGAPGRILMEVRAEDVFSNITSGVAQDGSTVVAADTWYHFALVNDASTQKKYMYIDGVAEASPADMLTPESNTAQLQIGSRRTSHSELGYVQNGLMDDLYLTSEVLSADQINAIIDKGVAVASGLDGATAIIKEEQSIKRFNYTNGNINFSANRDLSGAEFRVVNIAGSVIKSGIISDASQSISLQALLTKGVYIIIVRAQGKSYVHKLVVNN